MTFLDELLSVCARHTRGGDDGIVIAEAYLPYLPPDWNGMLVLAEAQNLSRGHRKYVDELRALDARGRMTRLRGGSSVGVAPWDDGSLKLAVASAFGADCSQIAVSNAVPWSRRKDDGSNANPSAEMTAWAAAFWKDLLPLVRPERIITAGKVAQDVITQADPSAEYDRTSLRLPSPQAMSRVSGMFRKEDLLARYPEVRRVANDHPEWKPSLNKVFYACHAVSRALPVRGSVQPGDAAAAAPPRR